METIALEHFKDLFASARPHLEDISKILEAIPCKVTENQNKDLTRVFTPDEINLAIKGMHPTKAPGPDGMQALFYQNY